MIPSAKPMMTNDPHSMNPDSAPMLGLLASITRPVMCAGLCRNPITDYQSLDGIPIHLIFMIAAGQNQHAEYLRLLSSLSLKLKSEKLRNSLISAPDTETFYQILTHQEK